MSAPSATAVPPPIAVPPSVSDTNPLLEAPRKNLATCDAGIAIYKIVAARLSERDDTGSSTGGLAHPLREQSYVMNRSSESNNEPRQVSVDDLPPPDIAAKAEKEFTRKIDVTTPKLSVLAILAGAYIAFGAIFSQIVLAGGEALPYGVVQLLSGLAFSLGLILVIVGGAELFTGNTMMVIPRAQERATALEVLRAWLLAYGGNFLGALFIALLFVFAGTYTAGEGKVGLAVLTTAERKAELSTSVALSSGILANMLVCLAVWLALSARTTHGKILAIIGPIAAFVAAGFEHSVANMALIPMGLLVHAWGSEAFWTESGVTPASFPGLTYPGFFHNLLWSTLGNILGGGIVGIAYWSAYRRGK